MNQKINFSNCLLNQNIRFENYLKICNSLIQNFYLCPKIDIDNYFQRRFVKCI